MSGEARPLIQIEISSCCKYPANTYTVYGTHGGLTGDTRRLEWQYFDPAAAPELHLTTTPIQKADGTPAYCSDALEWQKEEWRAAAGLERAHTGPAPGGDRQRLHRSVLAAAGVAPGSVVSGRNRSVIGVGHQRWSFCHSRHTSRNCGITFSANSFE